MLTYAFGSGTWLPFLFENILADKCDPVSADNFKCFSTKKYDFVNVKQWYMGERGPLVVLSLKVRWNFCALTTSHCYKFSGLDVFTSPLNLLGLTDFDVFRNNTPFINMLLQELVFDRRPVHVGFTVYKLALRGVYLSLCLFVPIRNVASNALYSYSIGCTAGGVQCRLATASWKFSLSPDLYSSFFVALQPIIYQGVLIIKATRSHSDAPHSVGILWANDFDERTISITTVFVRCSSSCSSVWERHENR